MSIWDGITDAIQGFGATGGFGNLRRYQEQQAVNQEQEYYSGLLNKYGIDKGMQGPVPASFYMEAARLPSIRQAMLTGQMSQGGAMQRQQQAQQFGETSFPLLEQARLDQQEQQFQQTRKDGMAGAALGAQFGSIPQGMVMGQDEQGQPRLQMVPGSKDFKAAQSGLQTGSSILNALQDYADYIEGVGNVKKGTAIRARNQIVQGLAKANEAGALQEADIAFYSEGLPEIGTLFESGMDKTTLGVVEQLRGQIRNTMADVYQQAPEMRRLTPALYKEVAPLLEQRRQSQLFGR